MSTLPAATQTWQGQVWKGHGTENDFVIIPDANGELDLTAGLVRSLCDRHAGIGADGVLRVVRSAASPDAPPGADWFMDYRNADGSIAEMCGNGVRVFARFLAETGAIGAPAITAIGTRGGVMATEIRSDGMIAVGMGRPVVGTDRPLVTVAGGPTEAPGICVDMPNPHVVVELADDRLHTLDLTGPPSVRPARPHGQNVEFVYRTEPRRVRMRVHERGVGETRSCGTGICAAVAALGSPDGSRWQVDVPGGTCMVTWGKDGSIELAGPAVLVGVLSVSPEWWDGAGR